MPDLTKAQKTLARFQQLVDATPPAAAHVRTTDDAWTLTEIIGHLVDSASNNHQRFARLQHGDLSNFPAYEAEPWVAAQDYDGMDFTTLATLWVTYNEFIFHLASHTPESALDHTWQQKDKRQSLNYLIDDYYAHMQLHVDHYRTRLQEIAL